MGNLIKYFDPGIAYRKYKGIIYNHPISLYPPAGAVYTILDVPFPSCLCCIRIYTKLKTTLPLNIPTLELKAKNIMDWREIDPLKHVPNMYALLPIEDDYIKVHTWDMTNYVFRYDLNFHELHIPYGFEIRFNQSMDLNVEIYYAIITFTTE